MKLLTSGLDIPGVVEEGTSNSVGVFLAILLDFSFYFVTFELVIEEY